MEAACRNTVDNGPLGTGGAQTLDKVAHFRPNDLNSFHSALFEINSGPWSKIHQYYGHGEFLDMEFVANSGWHASPQAVFIEDQPLSRGLGFLEMFGESARLLGGDYGKSHSITPLIDASLRP
jgi:hypothetical protein